MINLDKAIRYSIETSRIKGSYFPKLKGVLAVAAYPSVGDVELNFSKHVGDEDARLITQSHINMVLDDKPEPVEGVSESVLNIAKSVSNLSYLYNNTELNSEIISRISKTVLSDIETLEQTVLPEIKGYQEAIENSILTNLNDIDVTTIHVRELPAILKSNTLSTDELTTYSKEMYNAKDTPICLDLDAGQYDKLIIDNGISELIGALAVHNQVPKTEFIESLRMLRNVPYGQLNKELPANPYDAINTLLALYAIAQAAFVSIIDGDVGVSSNEFKRSAKSLRAVAASQLLIHVARLEAKKTLIIHYDIEKDIATVNKARRDELIGSLDKPKEVNSVIRGYIASANIMSIKAFSTVDKLVKGQDEYLNEYKQQAVTKRLSGRDKAAVKVRSDLRVLFSINSLTDETAELFGYNKDTAKAQINTIINNATTKELLDTSNPIIIELMDKVKYPKLSVASYINALTEASEEYDLPRDELVVMAVIKMVTASVINSFE